MSEPTCDRAFSCPAPSYCERCDLLVGLDDYESRMASVAEQNSATLNLHVSWMQDVIMRTLQGLNLTDEQWAIVPGVVVEALEALPASPNEGPTDGTEDHSRP